MIKGMIVLDRSVDFITLMTTNYTCEGLIDENIGINLGRIKVNESMLTENLNPTTTTNKINNVNNNNQQKEKIKKLKIIKIKKIMKMKMMMK